MGWELEDLERPYIAQLLAQDRTQIEAGLDNPAVTGRIRVTPLLEGTTPLVQQAAAPFVQQPVGHPGA
jgi:type I restriction enzyme R subunit